ncbi:hypothetical protein GGR26_000304 [Lewinella marina]|uniref:DUF4920 domain-containing protein n=1 Tax=Neolewinella marina TaxID=438751 RepID=A0A2G0CJW0_9BACT|nr:DUF4920 domain-containing protein [Neolewinella marina]NJB84559.1 hypothetical protein [Neolewinella marina]PHL00259.1 DUF4920 domain-containing protein [Neolewinella marina]
MRYLLIPLTAALCLLAGCASSTPEPAGEYFGAPFSADSPLSAESVLGTYTTDQLEDTVQLTLTGTVAEVCQAKGCWMTVDAGSGTRMTVRFRDYGFFVPKDIDGQQVIMQGQAYYETVAVDELRHLAEDAGRPAEEVAAIDAPRRELRFLADGVYLPGGSNEDSAGE